MGIQNSHHVIIYDNNEKYGLFSAPRAWWMFRVSKLSTHSLTHSLIIPVFVGTMRVLFINLNMMKQGDLSSFCIGIWTQISVSVRWGAPLLETLPVSLGKRTSSN